MSTALTIAAIGTLGVAIWQIASLFTGVGGDCAGFDMRNRKKWLLNEAAVDSQWSFLTLDGDGGDGD